MEFSPQLLHIENLKKKAESISDIKPEYLQAFWSKYRLEFNYNSNHIEGNTLTYGHTQLLLLFDKVSGDYTLRELEEMKAHDTALKLVKEEAVNPEHQLSEKFIKKINELILVRPYYKEAITPDGQPTRRLIEPGNYKKYSNSVRLENGEIFNYATPEETPALMGDLLNWYREESLKKELHPVQLAAIFHYRFVRIHPFDDSNGRTARLMMNYILIKNSYAPIVIESIGKKDYLFALNQADTGNLNAFVEYILKLSERWQEIYLRAVKGEKIEEESDFEKEVELLRRNFDERGKVTQPFSPQVALSLYNSTFAALYKKIIEKLSSLDNFFYEKAIQFRFGTGGKYVIQQAEQIETLITDHIGKLSVNGSLELIYAHRGLQTSNSGVIDIYSGLIIRFYEFTYSVHLSSNGPAIFEKKYDEPLTESEITELISLISKQTLNRIKEAKNIANR
ncbi:MAG: Fic family protein [Sphingobacteriales bacterium]|nr:Fic family protein [Sphingobacteriales bacterium]MBI3719881.1 Fic family protein [Sphingobacteriales bacterium]